MIAFYNSEQELFNEEPIRTIHNGYTGGGYEQLIYLKNDDETNYYTDITLSYESSSDDYGVIGTSGWSVKYLYGTRQPTQAEWDLVVPSQTISLPDIGSVVAGDTFTYHPIWIRVYCPGGQAAQIRDSQTLIVRFNEYKVNG